MGVLQTCEASSVRSSKNCSGSVSRMAYLSRAMMRAASFAGLAITIAWLAISVGGLSIFAKIVTSIPSSNAGNQYAIEYQSGPGYLLLRALEIMSPVAAVLGLVGLGVLLFSHRKLNLLHVPAEAANWQVVGWITLFMLAYLALPMVLPHWLNLRYISVLFGPFYLIAGVGFWYCASLCQNWLKMFDRKLFAALLIVAASIGAVADYDRFQRIVVRDALKDLSVKNVLDADKQ